MTDFKKEKGINATTGVKGLDNIVNNVLNYGKSLSLLLGILIGLVSSNSKIVMDYVSPTLDSRYVTIESFEKFKESLIAVPDEEVKPEPKPPVIIAPAKINYSFQEE